LSDEIASVTLPATTQPRLYDFAPFLFGPFSSKEKGHLTHSVSPEPLSAEGEGCSLRHGFTRWMHL